MTQRVFNITSIKSKGDGKWKPNKVEEMENGNPNRKSTSVCMGLEKLFNQKMPHDDNKNNEQGFVYHRMGTNNGNPN
jgi:hypothetical protein